ncbi:MAG TPA: hypothetical protein PKA53_14015 [Sphingobacterium sp.]|nr:hypothetical protein [Sphingobacterium sp.]
MERNKYCILILLGVILPILSFSQHKKKPDYTFLSIPGIVADGDLKEWEGQLYNAESEVWSYGLALQGNSMYAAVIIKDPVLQNEALANGIIFNLSYNDKKRDGARLFFPVADRESMRALQQEDERPVGDYRKEILNTTRGYYVIGFSKVVDGLLSFQNEYGIRAVANLDTANNLCYEAIIPLDLIVFKSDKIAVKLAVNTQFSRLQRAARNRNTSAMGPYGVYRQREPVLRNPYKESTEIWVVGSIK